MKCMALKASSKDDVGGEVWSSILLAWLFRGDLDLLKNAKHSQERKSVDQGF